MARSVSRSHRLLAGIAPLLLVVALAVDAAPASAATGRTVTSIDDLTAELAAPGSTLETVLLGADLTAAPTTAARTADSSDLSLDLAGHDLALGSLVVGAGASLRITDSTATGGTLVVDGAAVDTPVRVPAGSGFTVDGSARLRATGGRASAVIGARGAPDPYGGAGAISFLGHAVVDVQGSTAPGRSSSGVGGPLAAVHIGQQAVVRITGTSAGAALGGGSGGVPGDSAVLIDGDAQVVARSTGSGGAAIGSSAGIASARLTSVVVRDRARVTATGGPYGPGIGNGALSGTRTTVAVEGAAEVVATGGMSAAGVGGGAANATSGGDGAAVTIGPDATVIASGGTGADTAIGSGSGRAGASFGSLSNAGTLVLPVGGAMRIPAGAVVRNRGTITASGPISGPGAIENGGTIAAIAPDGSIAPSTSISGDRWAIAFDAGAGAPTGPTTLRLAADSIAAGGIPSVLPTPADDQVVLGWNTRADGSGAMVEDTTDLRTVATPDPGGRAAALTLHAVIVPLIAAAPRLTRTDPAAAIAGVPLLTAVLASAGAGPTACRVVSGALPDGLVLDPTTGVVSGTPTRPQLADVTIEARNRFGSDARRYALAVLALKSPPTAVPAPVAPAQDAAPTSPPAADRPLPRLPVSLGSARTPLGAPLQRAIGESGAGTVYAVTAGSLPSGLRIDQARATLTGSPKRPGRYRFTVTATTASGAVSRTYRLSVVAPLRIALQPVAGRSALPPVSGSHARVVLRGLLPGERYTVRWSGRVVARGTAHATRAIRVVRVPRLAGSRTVTALASDHGGARAEGRTAVLPVGAVLRVSAPAGVQANRALRIRVTGLGPGEPVQVRYEGAAVAPHGARADRRGRYALTVSAGWSWGWKRIQVRGLPGRTGSSRTAVLPRRDDDDDGAFPGR